MSREVLSRYSQLLGRLLNASGVLDVAADLSPEVSPTFVLESDRPEWRFLSNQRMLNASVTATLSAGNRSVARLRNPSGSNILGVVESIRLSVSTAGTWIPALNIGAGTTDRSNVAGAFANLDTRSGVASGLGGLLLSWDNTAVAGTNFENNHVLAGTTFTYASTPIVLTPGFFLDVYTVETDVLLRVSIRWRERELSRFELR